MITRTMLSYRAFAPFAMLAMALSAPAQDLRDLPALSAEPKALLQAAAAVPKSADTEAVIVLSDLHYRFEADGRYTITEHRIVQAVNANGAEAWNSIREDWAPWEESRPKIRARVVNPDGSVHELDQKNIVEGAVSQQSDSYTDRRVLQAPLPAMTPGSVIEEEVVTQVENTLFGAGSVSRLTIGAGVPVASSRIVFDAPKSLSIKTELRLLPKIKTSTIEQGDRAVTTFDQGPMDPLDPPPLLLPGDVPRYPYLAFTTGSSWQDTASRYSAIVERQIAASDVQALVAETLKGASPSAPVSRAEKARLLLARLHRDVRYTGVEFDEAALVPAPPADTLKRRFGDCKDKAATYAAMLRAAGIPAYLALLQTGPALDVSPDLPGLGQFDHAIVFIPAPADKSAPDIWVDATANTFAFGGLPSADQGRLSLIVRPETTALVRIPDSPSSRNLMRETREFFLPEKGGSRVVETTDAWDESGAGLHADFTDPKTKAVKDNIAAYAKSAYVSEKVISIDTPPPSDPDAFELRIVMEDARRGFVSPVDAAVAIPFAGVFNRLPEWFLREPAKDEKKRTENLLLPASFATEWVYVITPAPGFRYNAKLADEDIPIGPAHFTRKFETTEAGAVRVLVRFDTGKRLYTPAEAETLRKTILEFQKQPAALVTFDQKGQSLLRTGNVRGALDEFRALEKMHPTEALHRIQISSALIAAGAGDAARREAREAVRLEPKLAYAYYNLGFVYLSDPIGRQFKPGFDPVEAEKAYRKAKELDPDDLESRKDLALLLEHDNQGVRYSPKARLKEAIEEYAAIQDKLEGGGFAENLPIACLHAGLYADLLSRLDKMPPTATRAALRLSALAASKGAPAALEAASKLSQDQRGPALDLGGQLLITLRLYPEAVALFTAMGSPSSNTTTANIMRSGILASMRRSEDLPSDPTKPESVVQRFMNLAMSQADNGAAMEALLSKDAVGNKLDSGSLTKLLGASRAPALRQFQQAGLPAEMLPDLISAMSQYTVEDDHEGGYLVRTAAAGNRSSVWVAKQEGQFRIVAFEQEGLDGAGVYINRLLDRKKFDTARIWLDWVRDSVKLTGGDDPLAGISFARLWPKGGQDSGAAGDAERRMRNAAWSLQDRPDLVPASADWFLKARESAATADEKVFLDIAAARFLAGNHRYADALPIAETLAKAYPSSDTAFLLQTSILMAMHRFDDVERIALERSKRLTGDPVPVRLAADAAAARGDFAVSRSYLDRIISSGKAEQIDWNQYAWEALYIDKADNALADSLQRNVPGDRANAAIVHTIASVMAEIGKTTEARQLTLLAMDLWGIDEPNEACWYVFGRIDEQFGLSDVALEDYHRISPPKAEEASPGSTWALAQLRVKKLQNK